MKSLVVPAALVFCVALATAQGPQPPPVTPMKFAYYPATDLKALANTLKGGGQIKFNRLHRGDHDFQGMSFRAIELDEKGEASFTFVPIRPGDYPVYVGPNPFGLGRPAGEQGVPNDPKVAFATIHVE